MKLENVSSDKPFRPQELIWLLQDNSVHEACGELTEWIANYHQHCADTALEKGLAAPSLIVVGGLG